MSGLPIKTTRLILLTISLALLFLPAARAEFPEYELVFEPITDESLSWNLDFLGMRLSPTHIYGNFSLRLTDPVHVDYVEFRVGDINESDPFDHWKWDLMQNATSEPFEWNFSTLDFSVGVHSIDFAAFYTGGNGISDTGRTITFFFEHQDRSGERFLYTGFSIAIVAASIFVVGFVCYKLFKRHSSRPHTSRFEKDIWYG